MNFVCENCGYESSKWLGRCPVCGSWNALREMRESVKKEERKGLLVNLAEIKEEKEERLKTDIEEFDRVLGGGLVKGSLVLIGGEPGIGKSTLSLQISLMLINKGFKVLYVSSEENPSQIKIRYNRLSLCLKVNYEKFYLLFSSDLEEIVSQIERIKPDVVIVDSIQTIEDKRIPSVAGSVTQVREVTLTLLNLAKEKSFPIIIISHVTKQGLIAGPKVLEHMVDVVLYFEGDINTDYRILRCEKNRFGPANEIGIFEMQEFGLQEVKNPNFLFLPHLREEVFGLTFVPLSEGRRIIVTEIQCLATPTYFPYPQRVVQGFDIRRLSILLSVLDIQANINIGRYDIYLNVAGSLYIKENACDLGIVCAITSAIKKTPIKKLTCFLGEVGLLGEIRPVSLVRERVKEAQKLGFNRIILPKENIPIFFEEGLEVIPVSSLKEVFEILDFDKGR
ncbi:MAG: DNA repair protein RadA [candidate division WOR-3 bacterium]|nr:DNA repair protein RadA [candidate division WOR-3 bacterium]MCX7836786.1 DNA repair protein RadA [candidate division WOR-3 bacterium]MDW8113576.1 DNA repair protein RadA [candidate division WOR-3 bacterium]